MSPIKSRLGSPQAWAALTRELGDGEDHDRDPGLIVLDAARRAAGPRLDALIDQGEAFDAVLEGSGGAWSVEGRSSAGAAWLRLSRLGLVGTATESGLGLLADSYPAPTWITDAAGRLAWANKAWLTEMKADSVEAAREKGLSFDRGADAIVAEAGRTHQPQDGFRWTTGGGRRRAWRIVAEPVPGGAGTVLAFALDMTEAEETRDTLRRHVEAHDETLNHLADAVAIFGPSKRLAFHNTAFQTLFNIDPAWLDERPTHAELLDRLRGQQPVPRPVDAPPLPAPPGVNPPPPGAAPGDTGEVIVDIVGDVLEEVARRRAERRAAEAAGEVPPPRRGRLIDRLRRPDAPPVADPSGN